MGKLVARRIGLALITLFVLSVLVFAIAQILPGNPARKILGPLASQEAVDGLNHDLGVDRPLVVRYADWISGFVRGDLGDSLVFRAPVSELLGPALTHSLKLALVAFVLVVPLGILGGVWAALRRGRFVDRAITTAGLSLAVMPEFVSAIVLAIVFAVKLRWLPFTAEPPKGAGALTQLRHLLLPALALTAVLFGYIARMARTGMVEALESDYTRTAVLKGLPWPTVIRRHVLRNALLPTIAVISTQTGYLIGGLVVIELLFNYNGLGRMLFRAAQGTDLPLLQSGVLVIGLVYVIATLAADLLSSTLNPRVRHGGDA